MFVKQGKNIPENAEKAGVFKRAAHTLHQKKRISLDKAGRVWYHFPKSTPFGTELPTERFFRRNPYDI